MIGLIDEVFIDFIREDNDRILRQWRQPVHVLAGEDCASGLLG
jgi:hypothetical protein